MKKKKRLFLLLIPVFLLYIIIGLKNDLTVTEYDYYNEKLPAAFDGFKILQISDLHCKNFGTDQSELLQAINAYQPDIIVLTGDIVDEDHDSVRPVYDLIVGLNEQYPIYYITGNHELESAATQNYRDMLNIFGSYGVTLLDDQCTVIEKDGESVYLYGQKFRSLYITDFLETPDEDKFNILLYHASDYFDLIAPYNYDLVFSGHLHGGVVRLPLVGGLLGADGSFFPTYTKGMYTESGSTLIASAGLGDTRVPRFYNDPEIVVVTLHSSSD
ncbi:MAG: metallophosphoesterase [Lachnospiraceae bacterium]|nr:metallophosphoesterase [Lachnospiraceae bacterium]